MRALFIVISWALAQVAAGQMKKTLIFSDDFMTTPDSSVWKVEVVPLPGSSVYVKNDQLILDTKGGVTVWLNKKLKGDILIEYRRKILFDTGTNDRLSDLNSFWMATDPRNENVFIRSGILEEYDSLRMYYVGMGGNNNSTTRFRKYQGTGEKTLLQEYTDAAHLLEANRDYLVSIEVTGKTVRYKVNGAVYFEYTDPLVLKEGYFGFRSTKSRQAIEWIKIYQLTP